MNKLYYFFCMVRYLCCIGKYLEITHLKFENEYFMSRKLYIKVHFTPNS